uniref:Protein kinase domain-containing protein n=1 Tax=Caenorhabditis tropicalis TaxID=1561998 RepID=A0A1I7U5Q9_9PELO
MVKRNFEKMAADSQAIDKRPNVSNKLSRLDAPARLDSTSADSSTDAQYSDQLLTADRPSTSDQGSSINASTEISFFQLRPYVLIAEMLNSVPEKYYDVGGLPRINVKQTIVDKFETMRFLGYGSYATIWLVKNKVDGDYEALKITKSDPKYQESSLREIRFMKYLLTEGQHKNIVQFLGNFEMTEQGAIHHAMRFKVLGPNLNEILSGSATKFHPDVLRSIIKQLLKAVEYVHKHGIIHMDIKPGNIMIEISEDNVGMIAKNPKTSYNIYLMDLTNANSRLTVKLGDFGMSFQKDLDDERTARPTCTYRSPESFLTTGIDFPIDMWSVGCTIYKLATRERLFSCKKPEGHSYRHIKKMAKMFGDIPKAPYNALLRPECSHIFEEDGYFPGGNSDFHKILADKVTNSCLQNSKDAECFSKFVSLFFKLDPKKRVTAKEALENQFPLPNGDKSVRGIETAKRPGMPSVGPSKTSIFQPSSFSGGN